MRTVASITVATWLCVCRRPVVLPRAQTPPTPLVDVSSFSVFILSAQAAEAIGPDGPWPLWHAPISGPPTFEPRFKHCILGPYISAFLHRHYNVIENCILCCGSVHTTRVEGFTARVYSPSTRVSQNFTNFTETSPIHLQNRGWHLMLSH